MELSKAAQQEALSFGLESFDVATKDQSDEIKDWRAIFEVAFQSLLSLGSTDAVQLFAMMCISSLDFFTYSELEDALTNHSKECYVNNMILYSELNKKNKECGG